MSQLKLYGMKTAYDEIITTAVKRQHEPQQIVGDLLNAEISEKQARSIKYQMTIAKLPLAKEVDEFSFEETPVNETLVRDLAAGEFLEQQRNVVLIGGTGTGKSHLAVSIARACCGATSQLSAGRHRRWMTVTFFDGAGLRPSDQVSMSLLNVAGRELSFAVAISFSGCCLSRSSSMSLSDVAAA
jgi:DNA replication protein DnaC